MTAFRGGIVAALVFLLVTAGIGYAQPANDECANATVITSFPFNDIVDTTTATVEPGDPVLSCAGAQEGKSVWYRWTAPARGALYRIDTLASDYSADVSLHTGSCGALMETTCSPEALLASVEPGATVLLEVADEGLAGGNLALLIERFDEFVVTAEGAQKPAVAASPNGNFLVLWHASGGLKSRLYDTDGVPLAGELLVSADEAVAPLVTGGGAGDFVAVWGESGDVRAQRLDETGAPIGPSFVANSHTTGVQAYPDVAADGAGNFIVVWAGPGPGGPGVQARRFDSSGAALGVELKVDTTSPVAGAGPAVAMSPDGRALVTWVVEPSDYEVVGQRLDASGTPVGGEFQLNSALPDGFTPSAAADAIGNFVVSWQSHEGGPYGFYSGAAARRIDAAGDPLTPELAVSESAYFLTGRQRVASDPGGNFMVAWETYESGGSAPPDVGGRRYDASGTPLEPDFVVSHDGGYYGGFDDYEPDVAANPAGNFMVVWSKRGFPDPGESGVIARVFPAPGISCAPVAATGCRAPIAPLKSKMLLIEPGDAVGNQLRWKLVKGAATDAADFGDPTAGEDYVLCMYDASSVDGALLFQAKIPAGGTCGTKPCWKGLGAPTGEKGFRYKNRARTPNGILKLVLKPGVEGKAKIIVSGGRETLFTGAAGAPPLPLPLPVVMQLQNASGGCWQATYDDSGLGVNDGGFFKGSGS